MSMLHVQLIVFAGSLAMVFLRSAEQTLIKASPAAETCHTAPRQLPGGEIHVLRVKVLSSQSTDGTYADEGYGQGEFDSVSLIKVIRSPIHWRVGLTFRVHPFPGDLKPGENYAAEHMVAGKEYLIIYTYHLDHEPRGKADLIGLTRCGVHENTPEDQEQVLSSYPR